MKKKKTEIVVVYKKISNNVKGIDDCIASAIQSSISLTLLDIFI